ncbi:rootletin [Drosophila rhopaloa]|uniref:Myosin-4 n=1 Tax=Drosophila rhopaloa TaxID=1041015 RepID=A0A6P4DUW4_DRORH|nr:rootletin [Drosophila rhopaloa]XP_016969177.1 rootletin [Drosophila rhopaloa]
MAGAKKRAADPLAGSVPAKAPKKSTVSDKKNIQIPTAMAAEFPKSPTPENPALLKKFSKLKAPNKHHRTEPSTNEASNRTPRFGAPIIDAAKTKSVEKPKVNPGKITPPVSTEAPKKMLKRSSKSPTKLWKDIQKLSPGTGIILDSFMEKHNDSLINLKREGFIMASKMQANMLDSSKKNSENLNLKKKLANTERELSGLKKDLLEQQEKNAENIKKYTKINQEYTSCEKKYDKELGIIKACVTKQNTDLKAAQSRIATRDLDLKNLQQTNRELAGVINNFKIELERSKVINTELMKYNNEITEEFEGLKITFEAMTAEKELCEANISQLSTELNEKNIAGVEAEERIKQLSSENKKVLSKLVSELECSENNCLEQQRLTDQAVKDLELALNEINILKTIVDERERNNVSLNDELKKTTERLSELVNINESYYNELCETKLKHSQDIKDHTNAHETALLELKALLAKGSLDFTQLKNSSDELQKENHLKVAELQGKLNEMELQRKKQEELCNELQMKTNSYEKEIERQQQQLSNQIEIMTSKFEAESLRNADETQALKAALVQSDGMLKAEQTNMQRLAIDHEKLEILFAKVQDEKEKITTELSAAKLKFTQELNSQEIRLQKKLSEMQMEIKNKESEMLELEREQNNEMAVLKFKMNRINSLIDQPVHKVDVDTSLQGSKIQNTKKNAPPKKNVHLPGSSKKRNAGEQGITTGHSTSFQSEDGQPLVSANRSAKSAHNVPTQLSTSKLQDAMETSKTQSTPKKVQPDSNDDLPSSSKTMFGHQRQIGAIHLSDFESEDDQPVLSYKNHKLSAVVKPQQEDLFDILKKSN